MEYGNTSGVATVLPQFVSDHVALEVKNLVVEYRDGVQAVKNISFSVPRQAVTAIIGPSGCGKSTALRALNRMNELIPGTRTTGEVLFHSKNIYDPNVDPVTVRRHIGMVFQKPNPFPKSIFDNIAYGLKINGVKDRNEIEQRVIKSLKRAALYEEVKNRITQSALSHLEGSNSVCA
jgi:phosphate transport system ATP-binding protein